MIFKTLYENTQTIKREKGKIPQVVSDLKVPQMRQQIVDIFELFFNSEVVDKIVREINRYAEQFLQGKLIKQVNC
jgi:S-adenosylmethionine synthetase